jgi:uncharacterized protein
MPLPLIGIPGALAIGVSLGLLGSGGSIITVPVLVYLFGQDPKQAVAGSLFVVGVVALTGALGYLKRRSVDLRAVMLFGIPGMVGTSAGTWASAYLAGQLQLGLFAVVMLVAAAFMLKGVIRAGREPEPVSLTDAAPNNAKAASSSRLVASGIGVGMLTGVVGVGGGFLIVPALIAAARLDLPRATGTSLAIIALNCVVGFAQHSVANTASLNWTVLLTVAALGIAGSLAGQLIAGKLSPRALRITFALTLVAIAASILIDSANKLAAT